MNTKDIEQMEHFNRIRDEETKLRKQKDDRINNKVVFQKKANKIYERQQVRSTAGTVPFYERLSQKDHKLETRLREEGNQKRKLL